MAVDLDEAAQILLSCVCEALTEAGRPTCSCGLTVGQAAIGVVCECGTRANPASGELYVHLVSMYEADPTDLLRAPQIHPCRRTATVADFDIELFRCFPTIDERGKMPGAEEQTSAAIDLHADVQDMWQAVTCCTGLRLIPGDVTIGNPDGGISVATFRVSVEVTPRRSYTPAPDPDPEP